MIYPPADITAVNCSAEHDTPGCGQTHTRPAGPDGQPVHPWGLSCSSCEAHLLATDSRWVRTVTSIPLTFDQQQDRDALKDRAGQDRDQLMMRALSRLAGLELPASVAQSIPGASPVAAMLACPGCGQAQPGGHQFCGQCGSAMRQAVPAAELAEKAAS